MFYLKKLTKREETKDRIIGDEFGWWIGDHGIERSFVPKCHSSTCSWSSSTSMKSCIDFDESDTFILAHKPSDKSAEKLDARAGDNLDTRELIPRVSRDDIDLQLIEKDADESTNCTQDNVNYATKDKAGVRAHCYTPERLIRCHDYRILTPSPRYASLSESMAIANILWSQNRLRNMSTIVDSKGVSHLETLLRSNVRKSQVPITFSSAQEDNKFKNSRKCRVRVYKKSTNSKIPTSEPSITDESHCKTEICFANEIYMNNYNKTNEHKLSTNYMIDNTDQCDINLSNETVQAYISFDDEFSSLLPDPLINSIPEQTNNVIKKMITVINNYPQQAVYLLDEDRFCETNSNHNLLTRLALTIEPDGSIPHVIDDPDNIICQLQNKVEKLKHANRDIFDEIKSLKHDFCEDMWKVEHLSTVTKKLHEDIHEMRYLDDLLSLLEGNVERISLRNWPFVLRHSEYENEEINLVV